MRCCTWGVRAWSAYTWGIYVAFLHNFRKIYSRFSPTRPPRPAFVTCSMKGGGKAWKDLSRVWRPGNEARALMYYGVAWNYLCMFAWPFFTRKLLSYRHNFDLILVMIIVLFLRTTLMISARWLGCATPQQLTFRLALADRLDKLCVQVDINKGLGVSQIAGLENGLEQWNGLWFFLKPWKPFFFHIKIPSSTV